MRNLFVRLKTIPPLQGEGQGGDGLKEVCKSTIGQLESKGDRFILFDKAVEFVKGTVNVKGTDLF